MKKLLEVCQYGDNDIRFNTDVDVTKNPQVMVDMIPRIMFSMASKLFGKNEVNVFAMIRALITADLALSNNRKEMLKMLDEETRFLGNTFRATADAMVKQGKAAWIPSGVQTAKMTS